MSDTPFGRLQRAEPGNEQRAETLDDARGSAGAEVRADVRADVRPETRGDIFSEHCPSRDVLRHVTGRWGVLLLAALMDGAQRFGELRRRVGGISEKMLAQTLVWLEQDGFVQRIVHAAAPPRVEYRLTPLGEEIGRRARALADWIEGNLSAIQAAQREVAAKG
ncbi:helix-turn-helix domain-containing protein [Massilia sp. 9096]|uniref:winged helix-turn-helix transcriptional regulator n=1 Tax=Massilia sp. 9096 TaxID=1500894 RepID=UPI0009DDFF15|nr:helix-turn-helix domain-containing protein [Massilia sp. 9096]